jgi:Glycosyltransferase family 87
VGNLFVSGDRAVTSGNTGHDFLAFYTAGTLVSLGELDLLYNLAAVREIQQSIARQNDLALDGSFAPFWNPPAYAWIFAPLSKRPYHAALLTWRIVNLLCLVGAVALLVRMLPALSARPPSSLRLAGEPMPLRFRRDWRNWALVPLLIVLSMPFIQALGHGQNTLMSLLLLCVVVTAWRRQMPVLAGACCGLMFYKPQLAAVVAVMLVLCLGARVCLGIGFVFGTMLLITGFTMPDTLGEYLTRLPANLHSIQIESTYLWERHATFKAFWRLLFQGRGPGEISGVVSLLSLLCTLLMALALLGAWWRARSISADDCWTGETRAVSRDRLIAATISAMPLLMPFYFDYDLLLLSVAAVLFAGEVLSRPVGATMSHSQKLLTGAWIGLYLWLMVNPQIAAASGINVTVVLLGAVAGLSIARACNPGLRAAVLPVPQVQRVMVKRAA